MYSKTEHCDRCGSVVYSFSKDVAISDDSSYCIKCAEELDGTYLAKNTCSVCTKLLSKNEVKFVLPSRLYSSYFFDRLPLESRLMCTGCYRKVERLNIIRQPLIKIDQIRVRLSKRLVRRQIAKTVDPIKEQ